jgi:hypothetical protein
MRTSIPEHNKTHKKTVKADTDPRTDNQFETRRKEVMKAQPQSQVIPPAPVAELKRIEKNIADYKDRRAGLIQKQEKAQREIIKRNEDLGTALMQERSGKEHIDFIAEQRALIEGWDTAVKQIDAILSQLEEERSQNARQAEINTYELEVEEARKKFITCVSLLDKVSKTITPVQLVPPVGYITADNNLVKNMVEHLQQGFDIYRTLIEWERIAPSLMSEARTPQTVTQ